MLVSVAGVGLFRSSDAGASFRETGRDLTDQGLVIADFDNPTSEPIQFSSAFAHDRTVYAYAQQSVVRSTDAGATWELLSIPSAADFSAKTSAASSSSSSSTRWSVVAMAVAIAAAVVVAVGWLVRRRTTHTSAPADER
jgi:cobalamin biosynthesis Mg chelatase CobN